MLVNNYFAVLSEALSEVKIESRLRQTQLVTAIDALTKTMQNFIDLTSIDDTFLQ